MLDRTKYFNKTNLIFVVIFLIATLIGFVFDNFKLFILFVLPGFILFFYRQYKFLKINYNCNNRKNFIIFLSLSIIVLSANYIYIQNINKPITFISNLIMMTSLPVSSLIFNAIESKIKKTYN